MYAGCRVLDQLQQRSTTVGDQYVSDQRTEVQTGTTGVGHGEKRWMVVLRGEVHSPEVDDLFAVRVDDFDRLLLLQSNRHA